MSELIHWREGENMLESLGDNFPHGDNVTILPYGTQGSLERCQETFQVIAK